WHREGFRKYWHWRSRHPVGRRRISRELRELILQMTSENPTWGAPRIHGELLKLGFEVSERTDSRWMRSAPKRPDASTRWKTFLSNHREPIAAMDFFTVPTLTFTVLSMRHVGLRIKDATQLSPRVLRLADIGECSSPRMSPRKSGRWRWCHRWLTR